jgi:hypothetical protein
MIPSILKPDMVGFYSENSQREYKFEQIYRTIADIQDRER